MVAERKGYTLLKDIVRVLSFVPGILLILGGFVCLPFAALGQAIRGERHEALDYAILLFFLVGFFLLLSAGLARRVRVFTLVNGIVFTELSLTAFVLVLIWDEASRWPLFGLLIVLIPCLVILLSGVLSILLWFRDGEQWRQEEIDRKREKHERANFWSSWP